MSLLPDEERLYRALFLTAEDVPGLEAREAVHRPEAEPGDDAWVRCGGVMAGFQVWQRIRGTELARLVDVRWLFPSEAAALRYHESRMAANAEGFRGIPMVGMPGVNVAAFEGQDPFGLGGGMRIYLFVFGRVSAKVFLTGIEEEAGNAILQRAGGRIGRALQSESPA